VAIALAEIKKNNEAPKPVVPPPPPPPPEKPKPPPPPPPPTKAAAEETKAAEETASEPVGADGFADMGGVALGNGSGVAIPTAHAAAASAASAAPKPAVRKVQQLAPSAAAADASAPETKAVAKVRFVPKASDYPQKAREAEIEGLLRVEVTIDETGKVIAAKCLNSLGYGLDEVALSYAKRWEFEPATRGGKPVIGKKILPFRFSLQ
jgi:protein TonB